MDDMTSELNLRERKKLATRETLSHAAWSLMIEHGIDSVTPEAIAETADVSSRTFRNYFSSREEAILDGLMRRMTPIPETLRERPVGEPLWDSLTEVLPNLISERIGARDDFVVLLRVIRENPAMLAQHLVVLDHGRRLFTEIIAERTGTDPERDLAPCLLAAAVAAALRTSIEVWADNDAGAALPDLIRDSLAQLRAGLPLGAAAPAT